MRPGLGDAKQWFSADLISDEQFAAYLSILHTDPNWCLVDLGGESVRTLRLLYFPDGVPFDMVLDRTATGWLPRLS